MIEKMEEALMEVRRDLDAERAASEAMHTHLRWAVDAWLARLEFERALGARLDETSPLDLPLLSTPLTPGS